MGEDEASGINSGTSETMGAQARGQQGLIQESATDINFIPAKILAVERRSDKHRITVRILLRNYRGSFNTLKFGENTPFIGACHGGQLDLIYHRDPGLKEGQPFPLWTIQ
jgi:hypothetical protein